MATGYERFTNEGFVGEGGPSQVPPSYDEASGAPSMSSPPTQPPVQPSVPTFQPPQSGNLPQQFHTGYQQPAQQLPQQQLSQQQMPKVQFPQPQQPGTYVYEQQMTQPPVPQTIVHTTTTSPVPKDYLGLAVFTLICTIFFSSPFCWPIGICALVKSNEVKNRVAVGDFDGAAKASAEVKRLSTIGLVCACISTAVTVVAIIVMFSNSAASDPYYG